MSILTWETLDRASIRSGYGMGKDYQKRVIMFTNEFIPGEGRNPTVDEIAVEV